MGDRRPARSSVALTTVIWSCSRMSETKPSSELLTSIQSADAKGLKEVTTIENLAAKHDMTMFGVAKFDKNKLKSVETTEKNVLPTAEDINKRKKWRNLI